MAKYTDEEHKVYMKAFSGSKAKSVKGRMKAGDTAVIVFRKNAKKKPPSISKRLKDRPKTVMEAVDKAVKGSDQ